MSEYYVPTGAGEAEFTEKRSRFLGHVRPVDSEEEARDFIAAMASGSSSPAAWRMTPSSLGPGMTSFAPHAGHSASWPIMSGVACISVRQLLQRKLVYSPMALEP